MRMRESFAIGVAVMVCCWCCWYALRHPWVSFVATVATGLVSRLISHQMQAYMLQRVFCNLGVAWRRCGPGACSALRYRICSILYLLYACICWQIWWLLLITGWNVERELDRYQDQHTHEHAYISERERPPMMMCCYTKYPYLHRRLSSKGALCGAPYIIPQCLRTRASLNTSV